jgi:predicted unusual protein kinase regulating ubiquinone biosynthesis (AarF/ABC1/UbiB family)
MCSNTEEENGEVRAMELAKLLTKLGPSFIKIGQSLSIRTDLLSPAYVKGLQTLQDQVPSFDSAVAKQMMREEWGVSDLKQVLKDIGDEPVAAASLGQVYKATTKDGIEVAIKVQRPNIMEQIALDMHLIRSVAPVLKTTFNLNTDLAGTVDAWGAGFVDELDYLQEASNANVFMEEIQNTPLKEVVFAPTPIDKLTTGKVLTTEWVVGERLDKSSQDDVTVLCSIAMNSYLTMMLEIGLLHCDPHPGNLLRTTDGRLCILDWGMVTRLDENLQLTLIEHMAHLTSKDYAEIPQDLLLLGFIPQEKASEIKDSGLVDTLANIYGAWTEGGGAAAIDVNQVIVDLQELQATKGNLFRIPPYFAYIAKSFSVLEGIGLYNNPQYSIINECLPYVSKRLLTDQSERTGGALSTFIFGPDKANIETRIIDYKRVEQLVTGFGSYSTSASGALMGSGDNAEGAGQLTRTQLLEKSADQILDLVATEEETPLQQIFIEQLAKIVTASSRSIWHDLRERSGKLPTGRSVLGTLVDPLGLWRTSPLVKMNDLDKKTVDNTQKLVQLVREQSSASGTMNEPGLDLSTDLSREELLELSSILVKKVWDRRSGVAKTSRRLARQLLQLTADKLENGERGLLKPPDEEQRPVSAIEKAAMAAAEADKNEAARIVPTSQAPTVKPQSRYSTDAAPAATTAVPVTASISNSMPIPPRTPPPPAANKSDRLSYAHEILKEAEAVERVTASLPKAESSTTTIP